MLLLTCAGVAFAQPPPGPSVTLPAEVKVAPGRLAAIAITFVGDDLKWDVPPDLDVFREYDPDPAKIRLRLIGYAPGKYRLLAVACKTGKLSEFAACVIVVGNPLPPVPPNPPDPPRPPDPPIPPVPAGQKVAWAVVVEDPSARTPVTAKVLGDLAFWQGLTAAGVDWHIYDGAKPMPDGLDRAAKKSPSMPALILLAKDGTFIRAVPLPSTTDAVKMEVSK